MLFTQERCFSILYNEIFYNIKDRDKDKEWLKNYLIINALTINNKEQKLCIHYGNFFSLNRNRVFVYVNLIKHKKTININISYISLKEIYS